MKYSLFIDSRFPNQFWAEAMNIANYLRNWLSIRRIVDKIIIISKEVWIEVRQNFEYIQIFGSRVNTYISSKKCLKSDVYKT